MRLRCDTHLDTVSARKRRRQAARNTMRKPHRNTRSGLFERYRIFWNCAAPGVRKKREWSSHM